MKAPWWKGGDLRKGTDQPTETFTSVCKISQICFLFFCFTHLLHTPKTFNVM